MYRTLDDSSHEGPLYLAWIFDQKHNMRKTSKSVIFRNLNISFFHSFARSRSLPLKSTLVRCLSFLFISFWQIWQSKETDGSTLKSGFDPMEYFLPIHDTKLYLVFYQIQNHSHLGNTCFKICICALLCSILKRKIEK